MQPRPLSGIGADLLLAPPGTNTFGSGVMFARRKKSPFKGPMLNSAFFSASAIPAAFGSPAILGAGVRQREGSDGKPNPGLKDVVGGGVNRKGSTSKRRKSQIIEEEEEDEEEAVLEQGEEEDEDVEEVEAFQAVHLGRGERLDSITIWNDAAGEGVEEEDEDEGNAHENVRPKGEESKSGAISPRMV